jgi:chemotaxis protein methyltransferase WspC
MNIAGFASLLQQAIGLDAASIGNSAIERAVLARMAKRQLDEQAYRELVGNSASELQSLVEEVVVPETWFFRDPEAFKILAICALKQWLPAHPTGELRLLSLPCSTGEEPYSMAMALLQAGFPDRYRIDAVDISAAALSRAQTAEYGRNSFRGTDLAYRDRFFTTTAQGYRLNAAVRKRVTFHQGNLLNPESLPDLRGYDFIFCRNLLIYFDRDTQNNAVQLLGGLLKPQGVLFVGSAESGLLFDNGFISLRMRLAFAFRPPAPQASARAPAARAPHVNPPVPPRADPVRSGFAPGSHRHQLQHPQPLPQPQQDQQEQLATVSRLADRGELAAATQACQVLLKDHGDSVDALHLMGVIRAAAGDLQSAAQFYRKALYLDPAHRDTLLHLRLLLEKTGDVGGARLLRDRMQRLRPVTEAS